MAYKQSYSPSFVGDLKHLTKKNKKLAQDTLAHIDKIIEKPADYTFMTGRLKDMYHFDYGRHPEYRILYIIYFCCEQSECLVEEELPENENCRGIVDFVAMATKEQCNNLYNEKTTDQFARFSLRRKKPF